MRPLRSHRIALLSAAALASATVYLRAVEQAPFTGAGRSVVVEEPATDLPATPAPQVDFITLFPNQSEIPSGSGLNAQRFGYVLHGEARTIYDSNLFIQSRDRQEDMSFRIAPGVALGWGDFKSDYYERQAPRPRFHLAEHQFAYVDYTPSYTWYAERGELDTFDHAARLKSAWSFHRLSFGATASFETEDVPIDEIGDRVRQKHASAALSSHYALAARWSLDVNGSYAAFDFDADAVDLHEWNNENWVNYHVSPHLKVSMGGTFAGVDRGDAESSQDYQQARLRLIYEASQTFSLAVSGGAEWRDVDDNSEHLDGVFQGELSWSPSDDAFFHLRAFRQTQTGFSDRHDFQVATGASAQYRQRVFHRCFVGCAAGFQNSQYEGTQRDAGDREDNLFFVRPGVEFDLAAWLNCEISGEYRQNASSEPFGYEATKATVRFSLLF